jgi:hypothetical protein
MKALPVLLSLVLVAACGGKSGSGTDLASQADGIVITPDAVVATDGAETVIKDTAPPKECAKDEDCAAKGADFACNCDGKCIQAACREDKNCGSESYCDPCVKTCQPLLPACAVCTSDRQCYGDLSRCVDQFSYMSVTTSLSGKVCAPWCPLDGGVCAVEGAPFDSYGCADVGDAANGACIPKTLDCGTTPKRCTSDTDCTSENKPVCYPTLGICGCKEGTCPFGQACHPQTHNCIPGCTSDTECGAGKVCSIGLCQDACKGTLATKDVSGCPTTTPKPGKEWDCVKGHCEIPGMCFSPQDCHEKATYCDSGSNECVPGCLIDFDCKSSAKTCVAKECIDKGCAGTFECSCGQVCDLKENKCKTAEGKYCDPCDQQQENSCGSEDILCIGFKDPKTEEDKGSYCMPPCGADPDNPCPKGWQCQEIKDDQGKSYGKKCIRFCYNVIESCAMGGGTKPAEPSPETASTPDP